MSQVYLQLDTKHVSSCPSPSEGQERKEKQEKKIDRKTEKTDRKGGDRKTGRQEIGREGRREGGKKRQRETATTKGENIPPLGFREVGIEAKATKRSSLRNPRLSEIPNC